MNNQLKFAAATAAAYAATTIALFAVTMIPVAYIGSAWSLKDQQMATVLTLAGSAAAMLTPTAVIVIQQIRGIHAKAAKQPKLPMGRIALIYSAALLAFSAIAFAAILPQHNLHRAATQPQAQAEIAAERYLKDHHSQVARQALAHAFKESRTPTDLHDEITAAILQQPQSPHCTAPPAWRSEGVLCHQRFIAKRPIRFSVRASVHMAMRDDGPAEGPTAPVATSAHVQTWAMFVNASEEP